MKKYQLEITVFLSGALTMVLELIASRILSPYVGSSNLIWTTIIGIMLTSMSIGYWLGGKKADQNKENDINILANYLLIAAIATSLIPILETVFVNTLAQAVNQLIIVAIISATIVFGIPSFLLAAVSPIAVKLKNNAPDNVGATSGKISSLSTIGSIFGTFFAGFILIPNLGVRTIILGCSILLWILSFMLFKNKDKKYYVLIIIELIAIIGLNILGAQIFKNKNIDIIKDVDSEYSRIWVKEIQVDQAKYKTLQVDTGLESYINQETGKMGAQYLTYFDLFEYYNKEAKSTLMLGGAAYTYPMHYLNKYQDKTIDVVEIDKKMTEISEEEFGLDTNNPNLKIYTTDGRSFLNYNETKYDTILIDAFKGLNAPFELTTYEAMQKAYNNLNENGMVITNIISSIEGEKSDFIKYEYNTYKAIFDDVKMFKVRTNADSKETQNLILVGFKGNKSVNNDKQEEYQGLLNNEIQDFTSEKQIVTDNYAPIGN